MNNLVYDLLRITYAPICTQIQCIICVKSPINIPLTHNNLVVIVANKDSFDNRHNLIMLNHRKPKNTDNGFDLICLTQLHSGRPTQLCSSTPPSRFLPSISNGTITEHLAYLFQI